MKLFDDFEVVKFSQENLLFVTHNGYIWYIYGPGYKNWRKHANAGNDHITISNYAEVSKEELMKAMNGIFPKKETDFMRLCNPSQLWRGELLCLLQEDYPTYLSDKEILFDVYSFLSKSVLPHKSFLKLKDLLDNALSRHLKNEQVHLQVKELCFSILGRDIFKEEIRIFDDSSCSSGFGIMPARIVDYSDTDGIDTVAEMRGVAISIDETDVDQYLTPFLYKYFDNDLEANKNRVNYYGEDDDGKEYISYVSGFEWYLTHNYYTFEAMSNVLKDINDTIDALSSGRNNEFISKLKEKRGWETYQLLYAKDLSEEQIKTYNNNRLTEDDTEIGLIINFYRRFVYRMEYMMTVGKENGYDLISVMGP